MDIKHLFASWPDAIPKAGSVTTRGGETIPFSDFMLNGDLILLSRSQPDVNGVRRAIVPGAEIVALKFHDATELPRYIAMGFQRPEQAAVATFA